MVYRRETSGASNAAVAAANDAYPYDGPPARACGVSVAAFCYFYFAWSGWVVGVIVRATSRCDTRACDWLGLGASQNRITTNPIISARAFMSFSHSLTNYATAISAVLVARVNVACFGAISVPRVSSQLTPYSAPRMNPSSVCRQ